MRRSTKMILYFCFLSIIATQYTNCESYNENTFASTAETTSASTAACDTVKDPNCEVTASNKELLSLSVNLTDIYVSSKDTFFSINGTCFDANFPANSIQFKLMNSSGVDILDNFNTAPIQQPKCVRGEWDFQVNLPASPVAGQPCQSNQFCRTETSTLIIQFVAYDSMGQPVFNDLLAKKTVIIRNSP